MLLLAFWTLWQHCTGPVLHWLGVGVGVAVVVGVGLPDGTPPAVATARSAKSTIKSLAKACMSRDVREGGSDDEEGGR